MIEVSGTPLGELTEDTIRSLDPIEMKGVINEAQAQTVGGTDLTPEETANCVMIMVLQRKSHVKGNPRASKAAKANIDLTPGSFEDFK